ncbi:MAG: hypothetical protein ABGZ35_11395 [Planctomycetaceae bacterium]
MNTHEAAIPLLPKVTCPTCWHEFPPEDVLWVAMHEDLTEDRIAASGTDKEQLRFLPSRFDLKGFARDEKGRECSELACPRCLNFIVQPLMQMKPLFLSIFGAPGSGKSFYIAALIREMKRTLLARFELRFQNSSARGNRLITDYEQTLFGDKGDSQWVKLEKTQGQGDQWYYTARIDDQDMQFPQPYLYAVQPGPKHPHIGLQKELSRVICLYDNAGEQFLPGAVTGRAPVIDHLAKSEALLFVFDPIQEADFRRACEGKSDDPQVTRAPFRYPQAEILAKVAEHVRSLTRLKEADLYDKPLIVIVNKYDAWKGLLNGQPDIFDTIVSAGRTGGVGNSVLDLKKLKTASDGLEQVLLKLTPQIVNEARSFAKDVIFIPVTATGMAPRDAGDDDNGHPNLLFKQGQLESRWVELPALYALHCATAAAEGQALIPKM